MYDLIIVGGGIAGLWVGIEVLKRHMDNPIEVFLIEKYDYLGGRVVTHYKSGNQWEIGAGRIADSHRMVRGLIDKYNLTWVSLKKDAEWRWSNGVREQDWFGELFTTYLKPLTSLSRSTLGKKTLYQILTDIHGEKRTNEFFIRFPYWSEVHTLRADLALDSFMKEMKNWSDFGTCKEGLSAIIKSMKNEYERLGGRYVKDTEVIDVTEKNNTCTVKCKDGKEYSGKSVVLALHRDAVAKLRSYENLEVLKKLQMNPLLRMYSIFPLVKNKPWFDDLPVGITNSSIRFIIPVNRQKGIIMISYTDGKDAEYWMKLKEEKGKEVLIEEVMKEVRRLYPEKSIPDPIELKLYPWYDGCTYWKPGDYSPEEESKKSLQIGRNIFMCGESFSLRQAWIEGALEQAKKLLEDSVFLQSIR